MTGFAPAYSPPGWADQARFGALAARNARRVGRRRWVDRRMRDASSGRGWRLRRWIRTGP
jgi:hypothetical protein